MANIADRIAELEALAEERGVSLEDVGDFPGGPVDYAAALAAALEIDASLAVDPDIELDLIEAVMGPTIADTSVEDA